MIDVAFAIPGDLSLPTGGYAYDRRMLALLPDHGVRARHVALPGGFPFPSDDDLAATAAVLAALDRECLLLVDGLAFGALPVARVAEIKQPIVTLVHHPLAYEAGLADAEKARLQRTEQEALSYAKAVVVTSAATKRLLVEAYAVPERAITVAEPGTDPKPRATGSASGDPLHLLAVGAISPRKGYTVLVSALAALGETDWRLTIAGALDRNPEEAERLRGAIQAAGLADRIRLAGAVSDAELDRLYEGADIFVMPSLFEGYGMVLTEALARGLPIVCTTGGAAAETVPDAAAIKVPPGDAAAFGAALARLVGDRKNRDELRQASWQAASHLPRWDDTARIIAHVLEGVAT